MADLRYAVRYLWKSPAFSLAAVLTLAVAIGANSAIFGAVHAVLLRPLPIADASRLVTVWDSDPSGNLPVIELSQAATGATDLVIRTSGIRCGWPPRFRRKPAGWIPG